MTPSTIMFLFANFWYDTIRFWGFRRVETTDPRAAHEHVMGSPGGELFLKEVEDIVNVSFFIKFLLLFWSFGGESCWLLGQLRSTSQWLSQFPPGINDYTV